MNKVLRPKKYFCISNASDTFKEIYSSYLNDESQKKINIELINHPTKKVLEEVIKQRRMQIDSEKDLFIDLLNKDDLDLDTQKVLNKYKNEKSRMYNEDEEEFKKMSKKYLLSFSKKKIKKKLKKDLGSRRNSFLSINKIPENNDNIEFVSLSPNFKNKKGIEFPKIFPNNSKNVFNFNRLGSLKKKMSTIEIENCNFGKKKIKKNLGIKSLSQENLKINKNIINIKNIFHLNPKLKDAETLISKLSKVCKKSKSIIKNINIFSEDEQCFLDKQKEITMNLVKKY